MPRSFRLGRKEHDEAVADGGGYPVVFDISILPVHLELTFNLLTFLVFVIIPVPNVKSEF